jgi:hypothetical protein
MFGLRRAKYAEEPLFGGLLGYAASAFETFQTVSPGVA